MDETVYIGQENFKAFTLLLLSYGFAVIPLEYPFYRLFESSGTAYVLSLGINTVAATAFTLWILLVENESMIANTFGAPEPESSNLKEDILPYLLLIVPHYSFAQGMIKLSLSFAKYKMVNMYFPDRELPDPLSLEVAGKNILSMFISGFCFFVIVVVFESFMEKTNSSDDSEGENSDDDENLYNTSLPRVSGSSFGAEIPKPRPVLEVKKLIKKYTRPILKEKDETKNCFSTITTCATNSLCCSKKETITAVNNLSFNIQPGECFGLLGVNGAGKTTTFKMVTGQITPENGSVEVNGVSMFEEPAKARSILGYCPQTDALNELLTSQEHLILYAQIRGTPSKYIPKQKNLFNYNN